LLNKIKIINPAKNTAGQAGVASETEVKKYDLHLKGELFSLDFLFYRQRRYTACEYEEVM